MPQEAATEFLRGQWDGNTLEHGALTPFSSRHLITVLRIHSSFSHSSNGSSLQRAEETLAPSAHLFHSPRLFCMSFHRMWDGASDFSFLVLSLIFQTFLSFETIPLRANSFVRAVHMCRKYFTGQGNHHPSKSLQLLAMIFDNFLCICELLYI